MIFSFYLSPHQRACAWKQKQRQAKIDSLPASYFTHPSLTEQKIHALSLSQLVSQCKAGLVSPSQIMSTYAKKAIRAHRATNCLSDIMFREALATPSVANWGPGVDSDSTSESILRERPLMGVPVSVKETIDIVGYDSTIGYSRNIGKPAKESSAIVRLLKDAGALVHAKTSVPTGLLAIETTSDVFGCTTNPYNPAHSAGASTGGGAALLASGGSKIEVGTDLAGSVRIPAHFCGVWSLKGSAGRFPIWGNRAPMAGLEALPILAAPMAKSLDDLTEFWKRVVDMKPWQYDHTCVPLPWQPVNLQDEGRRLKWGVIWEDGTIPPTPACRRALSAVISALKKQGHEVVDFKPPSIMEGLKIGYQLLFSDGGEQTRVPLRRTESASPPTQHVLTLLKLPKFVKALLSRIVRSRFLSFFFRLGSPPDPLSADLYSILHKKTVLEERELVEQRDNYRADWHKRWIEEGIDFVLTVPHALPALENGGSERATLMSAGYTFIFSLLDYPAGVIPTTTVSSTLDTLPSNFYASSTYHQLNAIAKGAYLEYNANKMHGLPLGVQIVGRRMEEEKVLAGMKVVEQALRDSGVIFDPKLPADF
ncbi:amidase signature enzyme [Macrolepiota fuliginosa MF-IS2]|uniref:Amidase signature enzyme n=1 Tax=Macrolepiota fuliginosa MF-IS2 TaxID=1400762 RepID=A0A9P5X1Q8_9AGAR|nr:amidase signature enzyme [Macrolepiota fuliginosa MF-IS2]